MNNNNNDTVVIEGQKYKKVKEKKEPKPIIKKDGKSIIELSDGREYKLKDNKDRFYFPQEFLNMEKQLHKTSPHYVKFLINTGARFNEAKNVKVEDFISAQKFIILKVTKTKATKGETKGKPRYIPVSTQFAKYLKKYIRKNKLKADDTLGFPSNAAVNQTLKAASKRAGLKNPNDFSAHSLRKTMETWLMALNVQDMKILKHLGHDQKTAVTHYIQSDIFSSEQKFLMRDILGDLYER